MTRRPDFFIVGAPKAGTTSLYAYLEGHPEIHMSPIKEPQYFSTDVSARLRRAFEYPDDEGYLSLFAGARGEKRVGEASTSYLVSKMAPSLVKAFQPDARIIAMLRNPIDQMQAFHNERVSNGAEPIIDFEAAVRADPERRAGHGLPPGFNPLGVVYIDNAMLGQQLANWVDTFGRQRVHAIVFDDFAADTSAEFRRVLEFLEVDADYQPASFGARNTSNRRRGGIVRLVVDNRPAQWLRHRLLPSLIGEVNTYKLARQFSRSRLNRSPYQRRELSADLRRELEQQLAPDVAQLSTLTDRDLASEWFATRRATSA